MFMVELYKEIEEQIPNELYRVYSSDFSSFSSYFAAKNNKGFVHIYKITLKGATIKLERFRFTKQKELVFMNEYILTEKDEEVYKKYLDLYNKP